MPIIESDFINGIHNHLGTKAFRTLPSGVMVMANMPSSQVFKKESDRLKRDLRVMGFGECGRMGSVLADTLIAGYVQRERYTSASNVFMEENATTFCTVTLLESGELLFDYKFDLLKVSFGDAAKPKTSVEYNLENRKIIVEQEAELTANSKRNPDDLVYACMLDTVNFESELVELRPRGEAGSTSFAIPEEWDMENTVVYTFAAFANNRRASLPNYYHHVTEAEKAAIAERERIIREAEIVTEEEKKKTARKKLSKSELREEKRSARSRGVQSMTLDRINNDTARLLAEEEEKKKQKE